MPELSKRSRGACLTCKQRRRKCDEERPACRRCQEGGRTCGGYSLVLTWDVGIASRGSLTGAPEPSPQHVVTRPRGRKRDLERKNLLEESVSRGASDNSTPQLVDEHGGNMMQLNSPDWSNISDVPETFTLPGWSMVSDTDGGDLTKEDVLFHQFKDYGHLNLYSSNLFRSPIRTVLSEFGQTSRALHAICAGIQALQSQHPEDEVLQYHDLALDLFRLELNNPDRHLRDDVLFAGTFLCTFGIIKGIPWTIHLEALNHLLEVRRRVIPGTAPNGFNIHLTEVLGIMDIPSFVIGRRPHSLYIWQRYREIRSIDEPKLFDDAGIESTSGCPRSLLDIMSHIGDHDAEDRLWGWDGHCGENAQIHLWEATRFAAILKAREMRRQDSSIPYIERCSIVLVLNRLMSSLDALHYSMDELSAHHLLALNAAFYPIFVAGAEIKSSGDKYPEWNNTVDGWLTKLVQREPHSNTTQAQTLLRELERRLPNEPTLTATDIALEYGVEVALF